jgi:hypothetical protein
MDRLREYAGKPKGLQGAGRDEKNLKGWSERAAENSNHGERASDGEMILPDTGKGSGVPPTEMKPREPRKVNAAMAGKDDHNNVSSKGDFMPGVRRDA